MSWFFSKKQPIGDAHYALYAAIVAQSRQPHFYADWGVPDTLTGRFDMISLHMALMLIRLQAEGSAHAEFSQGLFDLFFKDMDRSLREMGVGDISVPKRIEKMGAMFYGLVNGLRTALDDGKAAALAEFVTRNLLPDGKADAAGDFAAYIQREAEQLSRWPASDLIAGRSAWHQTA